MKEARIATRISISLVATVTMKPPGKDLQEKEIFERTVEIGGGEGGSGIKLEKGSQSFAFSIIVPSTIATYDRHPLARVTNALHACVEGIAIPEARSFSLFSASRKGKDRSESRASSRPQSRQPSRPGSRDVSPTRYGRRDASPAPDKVSAELAQLISGAQTPPLQDEIKPLKGYFSGAKLAVMVANPMPVGGPALHSLAYRKEGRLVGVGEWKLSLQSDAVSPAVASGRVAEFDQTSLIASRQLSVGSYIRESVLFPNPSPKATIFAVRLILAQKYALASLDDPTAPPTPCPQRNFLVSLDGTIPDDKRPGHNAPALWRGKGVGKPIVDDPSWLSDDFKVKGGLKRLPDDTKLRPSTFQG
jgi:hypothetical protein